LFCYLTLAPNEIGPEIARSPVDADQFRLRGFAHMIPV
jgi:hypothetical protein